MSLSQVLDSPYALRSARKGSFSVGSCCKACSCSRTVDVDIVLSPHFVPVRDAPPEDPGERVRQPFAQSRCVLSAACIAASRLPGVGS